MPRRDIKTNTSNREESGIEHKNEPEEGEIVDDYELIVSSDEELSMRQRIRELEAENEEIEQIAVISRSYVDEFKPLRNSLDNNRAARVPTDASSISSTEFVTPKKRKRRRSKERKRKHCHHQHQHHRHHHTQHERNGQQIPPNTTKTHSHVKKSLCKRRQKIIAKKHKKLLSDRYVCKDISNDTASLDSSGSSSSFSDNETFYNNRRDDGSYITRDTLRLAVARNSNDPRSSSKKSCLKDKLLRQELVSHDSSAVNGHVDTDDDVEVIEPEADIQTVDEESSQDSMEEKELRLIALKSAVLKKHMDRKRRNAEAAYSPTDFDDTISSGNLKSAESKLVDIDVVDLEDDDSQNGCVIVSPEASPQLMMLEDQEDSQLMMDCKPIDMDIVNSDSEDATMCGAWNPKELTLPTFSYASQEFAKQFQYSMYVQEIELPPPPPGVDDYEQIPPPPQYPKAYNVETQDMELDNEELIEELTGETEKNIPQECTQTNQSKAETMVAEVKHEVEEIEEEEEEALRALLLSKLQSPKNQKRQPEEHEVKSSEVELQDQSIIKAKIPTESILKEAVKRLKIHSQTDILKEEPLVDTQTENILYSNDVKENNIIECRGEHDESMISLAALRKRLIKLKNQSRLVEGDQDKKEEQSAEQHFKIPEVLTSGSAIKKIESVTEYPPAFPNYSDKDDENMTASSVDISDITRRLQKIKDDILNGKPKQKPKQDYISEREIEMDVHINKIPVGTVENTLTMPNIHVENSEDIDLNLKEPIRKSFQNNLENVDQTESIHNKGYKTVKANFDANKNLTTFKVTISNSAALTKEQCKDEGMQTVMEDSSLKENNGNVNSIDSNMLPKSTENSQKGVKIKKVLNKSTKLKTTATLTQSLLTKLPANALTAYSVLRTSKIVKPNKVINTNLDFKRRLISPTIDTLPSKASSTESIPKATKVADNSRLITSIDQVKHMCQVPKFIISVQNSSNESSEDEWGDYDSLYKPLYDYNDNASPLSLNMESPCRTPIRSNSPIESTDKDELFEEKLDKFLKTVRTTVRLESINEKSPKSKKHGEGDKINKTPLAVRHLPTAAQNEYRKLVHRMKLLENQRKSTNDIKGDNLSSELPNESENGTNATGNNMKSSLVKQVLIRNANNNSTSAESQTNGSSASGPPKFPKANVLRSYENLYVKIGAGIVNHLDKSLRLVEEAKKAKISKLKLENRLKELKAEMDILQTKHKEEQQTISRVYPSVCATNDIITSLKQKRSKVFKAALTLGKTLKGDEYRLDNELKQSITTKSKKLANEIKLVNSIKAQDIANMEDLLKVSLNSEFAKDTNIEIESVNTKTVIEVQQSHPTKDDTNSIEMQNTVCAEGTQDKDDDVTLAIAQQQGGNTENLEADIPMNLKQAKDQTEPDTKEKEVCDSNKDSEKKSISSYISPLEHLRNMDSKMDPNGVVCPYDLMGNCEDATCKYVHISTKAIS